MIDCIPPTAEINVTTELPVRLFPGYNLTSWDDVDDLERERPQYFIVSTLDARDRYGSTTQEYYQWVASHSREVFFFEGRSFLRLSVFELDEKASSEPAERMPLEGCSEGQPGPW